MIEARVILIVLILIFFSGCNVRKGKNAAALSYSAVSLTDQKVTYDPGYVRINYPMGDVPSNSGVCTDVIIRAYRGINIDLQKLVHENMIHNFSSYPNKWGLMQPDANIDHRRVPNLMTFFERQGESLKISNNPKDYKLGDLVAWRINSGILHIGVVVDKKSTFSENPLVVHNIGAGQVMEDCLFNWEIIGHFRYN